MLVLPPPTREISLPLPRKVWGTWERVELFVDDAIYLFAAAIGKIFYLASCALLALLSGATLVFFYYGAFVYLPEGRAEGLVCFFAPSFVLYLLSRDFISFLDKKKSWAAHRRRQEVELEKYDPVQANARRQKQKR